MVKCFPFGACHSQDVDVRKGCVNNKKELLVERFLAKMIPKATLNDNRLPKVICLFVSSADSVELIMANCAIPNYLHR